MVDDSLSCVEPVGAPTPAAEQASETLVERTVQMDIARVGAKAPDFEGMAYFDGGFERVKLADSAGKWTMLCFYPGDFTFV